MNRRNQFLALALVVQLILAAVLFGGVLGGEDEAASSEALLLADFDPAAISALTITSLQDESEQSIALVKNTAGNWQLPAYDDFPALATKVDALLGRMDALDTSRLISRSSTSHRSLKVAADDYVRKIDFTQNEQSTTLYLGSSAGANAIHARLDGQEEVYLVRDISLADAATTLNAWIDTLYLSIPRESVVSLTLENANGVFTFVKGADGTWVFDGLAGGETFNRSVFDTLLNQVTALRITEPLGRQALPEYGLDEPGAVLTIRTRQEILPTPDPQATLLPASPTPAAESESSQGGIVLGEIDADEGTPIASSGFGGAGGGQPVGDGSGAGGDSGAGERTLTEIGAPTAPPTEAAQAPTATPTPQFEEREYVLFVGNVSLRENAVAVKSADSEYYGLVSQGSADALRTKTRESFILLPTPTPTPTVPPTLEASSTPLATETPLPPTETRVPPTATPMPTATETATPAPTVPRTPPS